MSLLVAFRYFLHLVQRPAPTDVFSWDIQPSVLVSFCQAIVTVKLPYEQIFTKPGKAWLHNNVIMWQIDTDKFPRSCSLSIRNWTECLQMVAWV